MSFYRRQDRHLPVRPNLDQLKHQAKDLLRAVQSGDPEALDEFMKFHPETERFTLNADKMSAHRTQDACAPEVDALPTRIADLAAFLPLIYSPN